MSTPTAASSRHGRPPAHRLTDLAAGDTTVMGLGLVLLVIGVKLVALFVTWKVSQDRSVVERALVPLHRDYESLTVFG